MYCQTCGKESPEQGLFCLNCGTRLNKECPRCAEIVKAKARICRFCGYEFTAAELADMERAEQLRVAQLQEAEGVKREKSEAARTGSEELELPQRKQEEMEPERNIQRTTREQEYFSRNGVVITSTRLVVPPHRWPIALFQPVRVEYSGGTHKIVLFDKTGQQIHVLESDSQERLLLIAEAINQALHSGQ